ncbi:Hypothetical protein MVR_LOCUS10 [uncultured virus]|nr:Hypothetical protein MVR_LOCUS10 [uncultured virus]
MLKTVVLICIVVIAAVVLYVSYAISGFSAGPVATTYEELRPTLETGDLIMFSCHWHTSKFQQLFYLMRTRMLGSEYGHVGIVYKTEGGDLYLLEGVAAGHVADGKGYPLNNQGLGGVRLIELDLIMKEYHEGEGIGGGATFAVIPCSKPMSNAEIEAHIDIYRDRIFESFTMLSALAAADLFVGQKAAQAFLKHAEKTDPKRVQRITCSEFVFDLLYKCDRIEPYYQTSDAECTAKLFWPARFVDGTFHKLSKVKYGSPIKYVYTGV